MQRIMAVLISLTMVFALFTGCSSNKGTNTAKTNSEQQKEQTKTEPVKEEKKEPVTLKILQFSPEYTEQMHTMAKEYNKQFPNVTLDIQILQEDYQTVLKTKINAGDVPDVFMTNGLAEIKAYAEYSADLTNEPFIRNIVPEALTGMKHEGKILGYPLWFQSYAFIYNKKIFEDAGITTLPKTLADLEKACEILKAKGVTPFSNGYKEWWVFKHIFSHAMAAEEGDYVKTAEKLNKGEITFADLKEVTKVFDIIDLTLKYGQAKPLETDFNAQIAAVAKGEAAMCHQGNWAEGGMLKINPDVNIGYIGVPISNDASKSKLMVDAATAWRLYKDGKNLNEAKAWLNWLSTSEYGKNFVAKELKAISTVQGAPAADAQLAKETTEFLEKGETYPWIQNYWPDGYDMQLGTILQDYVAGGKTKEQALEAMTKAWIKLVK